MKFTSFTDVFNTFCRVPSGETYSDDIILPNYMFYVNNLINTFQKPRFSAVKFGDPCVVTSINLFNDGLYFSEVADSLSNKSSSIVVPLIASTENNSVMISDLSFMPHIDQ